MKAEFPTKAVDYPVQGAELRLITCDGYDQPNRRYLDNLVVDAKLVEVDEKGRVRPRRLPADGPAGERVVPQHGAHRVDGERLRVRSSVRPPAPGRTDGQVLADEGSGIVIAERLSSSRSCLDGRVRRPVVAQPVAVAVAPRDALRLLVPS